MSEKNQEELVFFTGGIPSPRDYRDVPLAAATNIPTAFPSSYFADIDDIPIWYQRKIGACVGHAAAKYKQKLDKVETGRVIPLSARFLYAVAKCRDGYSFEGTYPRLVASILKNDGCATEAFVPNDTTLTHEEYVYNRNEKNIPAAAFEDAKAYRILGYAFADVKNVNELKTAIINSNGAMLLMRVGKEWYTSKDGRTSWKAEDILPLRAPAEIVSGHEVWLYGYEDVVEKGETRTKFYIMNSWSERWGEDGIGWFYHDEYVDFLNEAITMVDLPNDVKEQMKQLPTKETFRHFFAWNVKRGQSGKQVIALQTALMIDGTFDRDLYSELLQSNELGWFGPVTADALYNYQKKYKIASDAELKYVRYILGGVAGPKTRQHLNNWTNHK